MLKQAVLFLIILTSLTNAQSLTFTMDWTDNVANFEVGSIQKISWESNDIEYLSIEYSIDGGKKWIMIKEKYLASAGYYDWEIPNTPSIFCKIKLTDFNNELDYNIHPSSGKYLFDLYWYFTIYGENKWRQIQTPTEETLDEIKFISPEIGFAWSSNVLLTTLDGGTTWEITANFQSDVADFVSPKIGWKINHYDYDTLDVSILYKTVDGGTTWKEIKSFSSKERGQYSDVDFLDSTYGYLGVISSKKGRWELSSLYESSNGGETFEKLEVTTLFIGEVKPFTRNLGLFEMTTPRYWFPAYYQESQLYFKGILSSYTYLPWCGEFAPGHGCGEDSIIEDPTGWIVDENNAWIVKRFIQSFGKNYEPDNYFLFKKERDGSCRGFEKIYSTTNKRIDHIYFFDENIGWFKGRSNSEYDESNNWNWNSYICYTNDGGLTWEVQHFKNASAKNFFSFDGKTCWATSYRGKILKYEEAKINIVKYKFTAETPHLDLPIEIRTGSFYEGEDYFTNALTLPEEFEEHQERLTIFEGARFTLDEDAIYEDISLDIRFLGMDTDGSIVSPIDNTPLFMFLGIEVTGEQSGVTSFEDFYYFNEGKKARIVIPRTEKFLKLLEELGIDETNISFAFVKGGEYFDEGLEWEFKDGEDGKVDSLCLHLDHFSQIVGGKNLLTSVENDEENLPTQFSLEQNYPNPFNPVTTINYSIPSKVKSEKPALSKAEVSNAFIPRGVEGSVVQLIVYDVLGREVQTLVNEPKQPGRHSISFDASKLSSGVYYYQLKAGSFVETKKMVLMK